MSRIFKTLSPWVILIIPRVSKTCPISQFPHLLRHYFNFFLLHLLSFPFIACDYYVILSKKVSILIFSFFSQSHLHYMTTLTITKNVWGATRAPSTSLAWIRSEPDGSKTKFYAICILQVSKLTINFII